MNTASILLLALLLDGMLGEPKWLWSRLPHPAVLMGRAVGWADAKFNIGDTCKRNGILVLMALCAAAGLLGVFLTWLPDFGSVEIIVTAMLLAQKSLAQHVGALFLNAQP